MTMDHNTLVYAAKTVGLFYLLAMSLAVLIYVFWPRNKQRFDAAARAILDDEDGPWR